MIEFPTANGDSTGYVAVPASGEGPGVLVLHAWWGLNEDFRDVCDRLAGEGFVALAPDLFHGKMAATIAEAEALVATQTVDATFPIVQAAVAYLRAHSAVRGSALGVVGFSMGANWALYLSTQQPEAISAVVVFYGTDEADFTDVRAAYLGHFAEADEWEPEEAVRHLEQQLRAAGTEVSFHRYPGSGHWFFEPSRPDAYNAAAAALAWERTIAFLRGHLTAT